MDFVTSLPSIQGGYDSIIVVVDYLTKVAHLIPIKKTFFASNIARIFIKEIFHLHGLPKRVVSNRDAKLTSNFWTSLESKALELSLVLALSITLKPMAKWRG